MSHCKLEHSKTLLSQEFGRRSINWQKTQFHSNKENIYTVVRIVCTNWIWRIANIRIQAPMTMRCKLRYSLATDKSKSVYAVISLVRMGESCIKHHIQLNIMKMRELNHSVHFLNFKLLIYSRLLALLISFSG